MKNRSLKLYSFFGLVLLISILASNLHAQSTTAGSAIGTSHPTGSLLPAPKINLPPNTTSDQVVIKQSSIRAATDCIDVKNDGKLCGSNFMKWCNSHPDAVECQQSQNFDTTK